MVVIVAGAYLLALLALALARHYWKITKNRLAEQDQTLQELSDFLKSTMANREAASIGRDRRNDTMWD